MIKTRSNLRTAGVGVLIAYFIFAAVALAINVGLFIGACYIVKWIFF